MEWITPLAMVFGFACAIFGAFLGVFLCERFLGPWLERRDER